MQVRPFNLEKVIPMRDLDPEHIDSMVSVSGMIIRASSIIPDMKTGTPWFPIIVGLLCCCCMLTSCWMYVLRRMNSVLPVPDVQPRGGGQLEQGHHSGTAGVRQLSLQVLHEAHPQPVRPSPPFFVGV